MAKNIWSWLRGFGATEAHKRTFTRGPVTHVVILDGTMSSLADGNETHAGTTYKLLNALPASARVSLYYEAGIQWRDWKRAHHVAMGRGINQQIRRAYGYLASRYRGGDRIILMGYSRGAYAVRSLAGVIDSVGLLRAEHATVRNIRQAYRHYQNETDEQVVSAFAAEHCHPRTEVEMIGVWDTVKALGLRLPFLWKLTEANHAFHDHTLSSIVKHGYHALALDETREVYRPIMWHCPPDWNGRVEQVWFRGSHGDVGGQLSGNEAARPLANISLVWMLEKLEACGVELPEDWRDRFPCDPTAVSVGTLRGWSKLFLIRKRRPVGLDPSEALHPTATVSPREVDLPIYDPSAVHST
ncbi:DUF2235 domain-containing protein [Actibacterium lipolyticum]|uniref:DUF2235 domain-containing protein n=1 Tax=Actibacterium lipolyticum TaxID=1524263 RepID=UPI003522DE15